MLSSLFSTASSTWISVAGVPGESYSEPEVDAMDVSEELEDAPSCDRVRGILGMAKGSVGIGLSG